MKATWVGMTMVLGMAFAGSALAGDADAGKAIYNGSCFACHGQNGISMVPTFPNLAGQKEQYVVTQLTDFRAKTRPGSTMPGVAAGLSDADIANLAAYLSSMACSL